MVFFMWKKNYFDRKNFENIKKSINTIKTSKTTAYRQNVADNQYLQISKKLDNML